MTTKMELASEFRLNYPQDVTLPEFVLQRAAQFDQRLALVDSETDRSYTYSELRRDVIRCALALSNMGVASGDRVCILLYNCVEYPIVMMGVMQLGAICVPINYTYTKHEIMDIDCDPTVYITTSERIVDIEYSTSGLPEHRHTKVIVVGGCNYSVTRDSRLAITSFELLIQSVPVDLTPCDLPRLSPTIDNRQLIALIAYSSGTTGTPKGCMHSHHSLIATTCNNHATYFPSHMGSVESGEVTITTPVDEVAIANRPMAHMYGINMHVTWQLAAGFKQIVVRKFDAEKYVELIDKYRVTMLCVVPPQLDDILKHHADRQEHLRNAMSTVRFVLSAAVCLNDGTIQQFASLLPGIKLGQQYGMTELMTVVTCPADQPDQPDVQRSSGRPVPGVRIKVANLQTKQQLGPNEYGDILVKSASAMLGYWKNPTATKSSFDEDGWYITGDAGHYDETGNLFVIDRIKDVLKYKGYQISPTELETVLLRHPDVIDAAVVGVKDEHCGDLPRGLIVVGRSDVDTKDIADFVNERVAAFKRLRGGVFVVDEIPRNPSGKVLRRLLVDQMTGSSGNGTS